MDVTPQNGYRHFQLGLSSSSIGLNLSTAYLSLFFQDKVYMHFIADKKVVRAMPQWMHNSHERTTGNASAALKLIIIVGLTSHFRPQDPTGVRCHFAVICNPMPHKPDDLLPTEKNRAFPTTLPRYLMVDEEFFDFLRPF